jgi:hypothetical protein
MKNIAITGTKINSNKGTKTMKKATKKEELIVNETITSEAIAAAKKEDKKLIKLIEKAPTKKEIKISKEIELTENSKKVTLINDSINSNFEAYLSNKKTIKELQQKNTKIISEIFKEVQLLLIDYKAFIDKNNTLNMEFNKKSLIGLLRIKLENNLNKELFSIYATVLDYMSYNLTIQLNLVSYSHLKTIIKAYKMQLDNNVYYKDITKNRIAKLKTKEEYTAFLKDISTIKSQIKKDIIITELIKNNEIKLNEKVA